VTEADGDVEAEPITPVIIYHEGSLVNRFQTPIKNRDKNECEIGETLLVN